ncbi:hypothetical protein PVAP13_7NG140517 [Panicum virgatum]|uniref:Uncharacterized protein n=1 Tax=Panicum virgatum TaxID=38727 RepID=A0A8T0PTM5_PANVG|nr:hypothetical protein PVAP13_7NG140517 [Panicum virgatum]
MPAAASTNRSPVARRRPPALPRPVSHHRPAPLRPVSRRQAPARSPGCARGTGSPCRRPPAPPRLGAMVSAAAASGVVRCSPASVRRRSAQAGGKGGRWSRGAPGAARSHVFVASARPNRSSQRDFRELQRRSRFGITVWEGFA